jgi:hypothetical protein
MEKIWLREIMLCSMYKCIIFYYIQTKNTAFGGTCVCRVPKSKLEEGRSVKC